MPAQKLVCRLEPVCQRKSVFNIRLTLTWLGITQPARSWLVPGYTAHKSAYSYLLRYHSIYSVLCLLWCHNDKWCLCIKRRINVLSIYPSILTHTDLSWDTANPEKSPMTSLKTQHPWWGRTTCWEREGGRRRGSCAAGTASGPASRPGLETASGLELLLLLLSRGGWGRLYRSKNWSDVRFKVSKTFSATDDSFVLKVSKHSAQRMIHLSLNSFLQGSLWPHKLTILIKCLIYILWVMD